MKLTAINGKVTFQIKTGDSFVQNTMSETAANEIMKNGEITKSDRPDYPICVNGNIFFPGEEEPEIEPDTDLEPVVLPQRKGKFHKEVK